MKTPQEIKEAIKKIVDELDNEARGLRGDTLVSISEGFHNEQQAGWIEKLSRRLKKLIED